LSLATYPYARGRGGISIAKYHQDSKRLTERLSRFLPDGLSQGFLDPGEENQEVKS
jgi:hypothetical protein